jgi:preprotein translocase subunit SecE
MARIRPARGQGGQARGQGASGDGSAPPPAGARAPRQSRRQGPPSPRPAPQRPSRRGREKAGTVTKAVAAERRGSRFLTEVIAELRKVSWPTRTQLVQSTAVVLVVVAIVAAYLAALDAVFSRMIDALF